RRPGVVPLGRVRTGVAIDCVENRIRIEYTDQIPAFLGGIKLPLFPFLRPCISPRKAYPGVVCPVQQRCGTDHGSSAAVCLYKAQEFSLHIRMSCAGETEAVGLGKQLFHPVKSLFRIDMMASLKVTDIER